MAKLRPRARIIRTIGDQLISGPDAALIELVKNAYDADSPYVKIKIIPKNPDNPGGLLVVQDRGHGMSYDDVVERWFEPATNEKQVRRHSPGNRLMLGEKGIGRFAVSRLGGKTKLISFAEVSECEFTRVIVRIKWKEFSSDRYLEDIDIPIKQLKLRGNRFNTGVKLKISELRDVWTRKRIESLVRELRRLASPDDGGEEFNIHLDLSEISVKNSGFDGVALLKELNTDVTAENVEIEDHTVIIPFKVQEHADYKLSGEFSPKGSFTGSFIICKGDNVLQTIDVPAPPCEPDELECGPLNVQINVYDRETDSISDLFKRMGLDFDRIGIRAARKILNDNAGIAIFRNGFRIRPYGEPENDWLELERQRVQYPTKKLGSSQVSGRVEIANERISHLVERSSREGLEHNGALDRLKKLITGVLLHVEDRRLDFREKAGLSRKASGDVGQVKTLASLQAVSKAVNKLPAEHRELIKKAISRDSDALTASLEEIDAYQKLLQSRASLGLVVAQVIHEGRRILNPMSTAAKSLFEHKGFLLEKSKQGDIFRKQFPEYAAVLGEGTRDLSRLFKRLDPVSGRRRGKPSGFAIREIVLSSIALFKSQLTDNNINTEVEVHRSAMVFGYIEDYQSALMNIIENAIYWLASSAQKSHNISISHISMRGSERLLVSNDGPEIDDGYIHRLFQAGFSLKSNGTGLGLAIAREACRASKGDLLFDANTPETTFIIDFPTFNAN